MRSARRPRRAAAAALALAALLAAAPGRPCGPSLPSSILAEDGEVLATPVALFYFEVKRRMPDSEPGRGPGGRRAERAMTVAEADREELTAALAAAGADPAAPAVGRFHAVRAVLASHQADVDAWVERRPWTARGATVPPRPVLGPVDLQDRDPLPAEFALYLEGAVAYHQGRDQAAAEAWRALLRLPEADRRYRSTWAAYMLGRLAVGDGTEPLGPAAAEEAARRFGETRELAARGFADSQRLAHASLGWQARAAWRSGRFAEAIGLYFEQLAAGDAGAYESLHQVCRRLAAAGPEVYPAVAAEARAREIFTLYLLAHPGEGDPAAWEAALRDSGAEAAAAGAMAWTAYRAGRFDDARRWAELAPAGEPHALWVRAKLLLWAGEPAAALPLLDEVAERHPEVAFWGAEEDPATGARAAAEAGAVALALGDYAGALGRLLRAGYWIDAAYVAERVMTADELAAYVDREWPRELPAPGPGWYDAWHYGRPLHDASIAWRLRHLLARRLAREGRWREAIPYYPKPRLPRDAAEVAGWLDCADDPACPPERRADVLWRLAERLRWKGLALIGSELDPDWEAWGGAFDSGTYGLDPARRGGHRFFPPRAEEAARWTRSRPEPYQRFHYRYLAADYGWRAAELMPDGDERTARVLATAGSWLELRDPPAAERFYRALVRRCGETALGREARRRRWFPPL